MRTLFADTSFYIALVSPRDEHHRSAHILAQAHRGPVVTTDFVLVELGNWLSRTGDREVFAAVLEQIDAEDDFEVVPCRRALFERGIDLYRTRHDKNWSVTDCISFVVMRDRGIQDALTADRHFEQAGFSILLS